MTDRIDARGLRAAVPGSGRGLSCKATALRGAGLRLLNEVTLCCGAEVSHGATVPNCWGVTLNLGQKSRNSGSWVYLPRIRDTTFWMATHWPETRGGRLCLAALEGTAGPGPAEQSPLVH